MKEDNKNYGNNSDVKEDETISNDNENYSGSDEVMKDLMSFYPSLSDIQFENILFSNLTQYLDTSKQTFSNDKNVITTTPNNNINSINNQNEINNVESNNDEVSNDEINNNNNNLNEDIINLNQNSLQNKNEYPSPSQTYQSSSYPSQSYPSPSPSSTSSLLSSPIQIPSKTLSQNNESIDDFQNHKDLNNDSLTNNGLNISKYYLEFKYNLLLEEKEYLEIILNKMTELFIHYSQCFDNNIKTTKDIFYGNYLKNNINYLYQKGCEFIQYYKNLDIKINNIINEIQETENNTFNAVHIQNYNQDNINTN